MFARINKSDSGFIDIVEMENFLKGGCPAIGDSVFLPMLFELVPVGAPALRRSLSRTPSPLAPRSPDGAQPEARRRRVAAHD